MKISYNTPLSFEPIVASWLIYCYKYSKSFFQKKYFTKFIIEYSFQEWDDELANLAQKHVSECVFDHDQCRATKKFVHSGQNIALRMTSFEQKDFPAIIKQNIVEWFNEYKLVEKINIKDIINSYKHE